MKTKDFALEVKDVSAEGTIEGYGSVFGGSPDSYGDIVRPGAFADSLVRHKREGTMPLMLWGHNASEVPIGNWDEMAEDGKGLWLKGRVDLEDSLGIRVHRALKQRRMRGLSIGYETLASEPDPKRMGVTVLTKLELWEVSPVNFPAKRNALVDSGKSEGGDNWALFQEFSRRLRDGDPMPIKEFEDILREAGVPKSMATAIASHGYAKAAFRSESESEQANDAAAFLKALRG
jgi:HK97 family phage prohead protease